VHLGFIRRIYHDAQSSECQRMSKITQKWKHVLHLVLKLFCIVHILFYHFCFNVLDARSVCVMACGRMSLGSLSLIWQAQSQNNCGGRGLCWVYWSTYPGNLNLGVYQALSCAVDLCGLNREPLEVRVCVLHHYALLTELAYEVTCLIIAWVVWSSYSSTYLCCWILGV